MPTLTTCTQPSLSAIILALAASLLASACSAKEPAAPSVGPAKPANAASHPDAACDPTGDNPYKPCPKKVFTPEELAAQAKAVADSLPARLQDLKTKTLKNLVFVQGGNFTMGDFGWIKDKTPLSTATDDDVLHSVTLTSYSLAAYKVSYQDFDVYADSLGKPRVAMNNERDQAYRQLPGQPAGVNWHDARAYCQWLGQQVSLPMDLATEAQWEYAARNRGQMIVYPTDNGEIDDGRNVPSFKQGEAYSKTSTAIYRHARSPMLPIGQYPPTPLGLYDMVGNGYEWVLDWYTPKYDKQAATNPAGPAAGTEKVLRSYEPVGGDTLVIVALTITRDKRPPIPAEELNSDGKPVTYNLDRFHTVRCAAQTPAPVKKP